MVAACLPYSNSIVDVVVITSLEITNRPLSKLKSEVSHKNHKTTQ